jgi:class 3 adenylate cyclase
MPATSRLATTLSADVVGYSHLLGTDEKSTLILAAASRLAADRSGYPGLIKAGEEGVLERLKSLRSEIVDPKIAEHRGRILKTASDGMLVECPGPVEAVRCAVEVQRAVADRNADGLGQIGLIPLRPGWRLSMPSSRRWRLIRVRSTQGSGSQESWRAN